MTKELKSKLQIIIIHLHWLMDTEAQSKRQLASELHKISYDFNCEANKLLSEHWKETK